MIELQTQERQIAAEIFRDYPFLQGYVASALSGEMGTVSVDDPRRPTVAHIVLAWANILAGDAGSGAGDALLKRILPNTTIVGENARWVDAFYGLWGHRLEKWNKIYFSTGDWNLENLTASVHRIGDGYSIKQVKSIEDVGVLSLMGDGLVDFRNYLSPEDFLNRGVGFIVERHGESVSGCASYAGGGGKFEISVSTKREHQGCGLAKAVASRMILYCLSHGIEPCWDAPHGVGGILGAKLGFTNPQCYTAYRVLKVREYWNSTSWM